MPVAAIWFLVVGGLLCLLGALGGIHAERKRLGFVMREQAARNSELRQRCTEMERLNEEVVNDNRNLASFLVVLPDVVRGLNTHMSKRSIPPLLAGALEQIFEPVQIAIYTSRGKNELVLAFGKGLPDGMKLGHIVLIGQGRVGLAAKHQTMMDREDLHSDTLSRRYIPDPTETPGAPLDLVAPMVHESGTLGVICVGGITRRQRDEKRMMKLVADLGSLALENTEMFSRLESIANADSLTGLSTKRFLNLRLGQMTHQAEQTHKPLSVIIFDIDHFKRLNDTYGHLAGDEVLKAVSKLLKTHLRHDDIAARYGGEEFVAVLPSTTKEDATRIAEKIRVAIEQHPFLPAPGEGKSGPVRVTVSGGVAGHLIDGASSNEILGAADQALYLAKEKGRNQIVEFKSRYLSDDEDTDEVAAVRV